MSNATAAASAAPIVLVKLSVPLAGSMLLTETFRATGRGAMILEGDGASPDQGSPHRPGQAPNGAGGRDRAGRP